MILPDVNLLLYAHVAGFAEHARARRWWEDLLNGEREVGIAGPALFGFLRLVTNPRIFDRALAIEAALDTVHRWFRQPHVTLALPGRRHLQVAFDLLRQLGAAGNLTTDVQLAALAIEHQGELHSNDSDFGRIPGLKWVNPLR